MKKILLAVTLIACLSSCNVEYNLGKTNCKVYTYGSIPANKGGVCLECDSLAQDAAWLSKHFPTFKKNLPQLSK